MRANIYIEMRMHIVLLEIRYCMLGFSIKAMYVMTRKYTYGLNLCANRSKYGEG